MKASDLFVKCLEEEGVTHIFGVPGEENADVMISLNKSKIKFVLCRHEQAAAFMADVYGRLTGKARCLPCYIRPGCNQPCDRCCRCQYGPRPNRCDHRPGVDPPLA